MPSDRNTPPTIRRIKSTAAGALVLLRLVSKLIASCPRLSKNASQETLRLPKCSERLTGGDFRWRTLWPCKIGYNVPGLSFVSMPLQFLDDPIPVDRSLGGMVQN